MAELISGVPSLPALPALPDTAAELAQNIPTILSCHASPTRPGRDETTPRGHPNYPPCWGAAPRPRLLCYQSLQVVVAVEHEVTWVA
jgi:hypothetical protein